MKETADEEVFAYNYTEEQKREIFRKRKEEEKNRELMRKAEALMELQAQLDADAEERRQRQERKMVALENADGDVKDEQLGAKSNSPSSQFSRAQGKSSSTRKEGGPVSAKRRAEMQEILYGRVETIPGVNDVPKVDDSKDLVTDTITRARSAVSTDTKFQQRPLTKSERSLYESPLARPV